MPPKLLIILFPVLFLLFSCGVNDQSIDIMSFNIRYDNPDDGINRWDNRKEIALDFLNNQTPDVIGFQEVLSHQLKYLQEGLTDYASVAAGRDDGNEEGEMVPIFYNKNKFELISSSHFWLSKTPEIKGSISWGAHLPRMVTWVQLRNVNNGYIFYVFNTHFSHVSPYAKNASAVLLLEKIKVLAGDAPVVVTGDFNADSKDHCCKIMTSNWIGHNPLWNARDESSNTASESLTTFNGFKHDTNQIVIDHIFANGMFLVQSFKTFPIKKDKIFISDHYPVMATLAFRLNKKSKEDPAKQLIQTLPDPVFETNQVAFKNTLLVPIRLPGNSARLYYTLDGSIPDTTSPIYNVPIEIKHTTTITTFAYSVNKYPSKPVSKTFIRKDNHEVVVTNIVPQPLEEFKADNYEYLFDMQHGDYTNLKDGSWLAMEGSDIDIVCKLKKISQINDLYISYLSRPKDGILSPKAIDITLSNNNIDYNSFGHIALVPSTNKEEDINCLAHINGQKEALYVKISLKNAGLMPSGSNLNGAPAWIYVDEIVIQ